MDAVSALTSISICDGYPNFFSPDTPEKNLMVWKQLFKCSDCSSRVSKIPRVSEWMLMFPVPQRFFSISSVFLHLSSPPAPPGGANDASHDTWRMYSKNQLLLHHPACSFPGHLQQVSGFMSLPRPSGYKLLHHSGITQDRFWCATLISTRYSQCKFMAPVNLWFCPFLEVLAAGMSLGVVNLVLNLLWFETF